jgi:hypothetical protein
MRNSRINIFLAALLFHVGAASADDTTIPAVQEPVTNVAPDEDSTPDPSDLPTTTGPVDQPSKVSIGDINVLDGDAVGLIDEAAGGLGPDMWINSRRDELERLLSAAPAGSNDTAIRSLMRRVLLTRSQSPAGSGKRALITIRIEKLVQGGMLKDGASLAARARLPHDPDFARVQADTLLLAGDWANACGDATEERLINGDTFWLELRAYCFAVAGDKSQVDLIEQLLEAQGKSDADYRTLRDAAVQHLNATPVVIANPTSLDVFLMKAAGLPLSSELVERFHLSPRPVAIPEESGYSVPNDALADAAAAFAAKAKPDPLRQRRAALALDLAEALGDVVDLNTQGVMVRVQSVQWPGARPSADEMSKIAEAASDQGRRGEAVLRVSAALEAEDPGGMAPDAVAQLVHVLKILGLDAEARSIAARAMREYRAVASAVASVP